MAAVPTPLAPAWTSAQRPLVSPPCTTSASHAVRNTSGIAAASSSPTAAGTAITWRSCTAIRSAYAPPATMPITWSPGCHSRDPRTDRTHRSAELHPGDLERFRERVRVEAHPLQQIGAVQCRGADVDHDVVRPADRIGDVLDAEDIGTTMRSEDDGAHGRQSGAQARVMMRTSPATGSSSTSSPSPIIDNAPVAPITAGMPSSRESTAAWLSGPPVAVTTPPAIASTML